MRASPFYLSVSRMKPTLSSLILAATTCILTACSPAQPTPPTSDDVRAARQAWYEKEHAGDFVLKSLVVSSVSCAASGSNFVCNAHEVYETLHKTRQVGQGGVTVAGQTPTKGEDDFKITLSKGDKGWVATD